jgi:predicted GNAT superfamily acetyltransferase
MLRTFQFKELTGVDQLQQVVDLQIQTWGVEVISSIPQLVAAIHNGGCVIGALDEERVIGFCYGFPGVGPIAEKPYLVSHMMAVLPEYRNQKLGEKLKFAQREWALGHGYEKMIWTFDPLEIRNGYLNLVKLGGYVKTYIKSYYGEMNDKLNKGMPSDRFLVEWDLNSSTVAAASEGIKKMEERWGQVPFFLTYKVEGGLPVPTDLVDITESENMVLIPIPKNMQEIKGKDPKIAAEWRMRIRSATSLLLEKGYVVRGVRLDEGMGYYVLERTEV